MIINLKKFFYTLRAATACLWVMSRNELPPIEFPLTLECLTVDNSLKERIYSLIELKSTKSESYMHSGEMDLIAFINLSIDLAENTAKDLSKGNGDYSSLDDFFRRTIK